MTYTIYIYIWYINIYWYIHLFVYWYISVFGTLVHTIVYLVQTIG